MKKRRYLPGKMLLLMMLAAMLGGCAEEKMGGGEPLPEGKYPLEFTSQMYGMDVTRATSGNSWDGGEEIALKVANDTRKYTVSDENIGKISAAGVTPFYWTSTGETKIVSAYYPFALVSASVITVSGAQNDAANYQASDALYAAPTSIAFTAAEKKLTFKHLPAKVVANLKKGDGVTDIEMQGATVKFFNQSLTASFDNATGTVTAASPGSFSVSPNVITTVSGFNKSVQALLVPCQMRGKQFIEVTIGSDKFYYTPITDTDGKLESGKVCTYEITVKRDGIEVVLKESGTWDNGGSEDVQSRSLSMAFSIDLSPYPSDMTYILPFNTVGKTGDYTLTVNWGDGSSQTISPATTLSPPISHTYAEAKEYKITIKTSQTDFTKQQMPDFRPGYHSKAINNNAGKIKLLHTPILNTNGTFEKGFQDCSNLTGSIPAGLFDNNPQGISFIYCFLGCSKLAGPIPAGLFDYNTEVRLFDYCFAGCKQLTGPIPEGLFDNNTKVTSFAGCFEGCSNLSGSIPTDLFKHNLDVTTFMGCFSRCKELTGSIPAGLFEYNKMVKFFSNCFSGCSNLTSIPEKLFDNNEKVTDFSNCFSGCSNLTGSIPTDLFKNNPLVNTFASCFIGCSNLTAISAGLFDTNLEVTTFALCFERCGSLTSIPSKLFDKNLKVTTFAQCFQYCSGLTGSIPSKLFTNNALATNFQFCFKDCTKLTMNSDIFCYENTEATIRFKGQSILFWSCFENVASDVSVRDNAGTVPALWGYTGTFAKTTDCFKNIGTVINATEIPADWK